MVPPNSRLFFSLSFTGRSFCLRHYSTNSVSLQGWSLRCFSCVSDWWFYWKALCSSPGCRWVPPWRERTKWSFHSKQTWWKLTSKVGLISTIRFNFIYLFWLGAIEINWLAFSAKCLRHCSACPLLMGNLSAKIYLLFWLSNTWMCVSLQALLLSLVHPMTTTLYQNFPPFPIHSPHPP